MKCQVCRQDFTTGQVMLDQTVDEYGTTRKVHFWCANTTKPSSKPARAIKV